MKKWDFWDSWMWETTTSVNKAYLFLSSYCSDEHKCSALPCCASQGKKSSYISIPCQNKIWLCTIHPYTPVSFGRESR